MEGGVFPLSQGHLSIIILDPAPFLILMTVYPPVIPTFTPNSNLSFSTLSATSRQPAGTLSLSCLSLSLPTHHSSMWQLESSPSVSHTFLERGLTHCPCSSLHLSLLNFMHSVFRLLFPEVPLVKVVMTSCGHTQRTSLVFLLRSLLSILKCPFLVSLPPSTPDLAFPSLALPSLCCGLLSVELIRSHVRPWASPL